MNKETFEALKNVKRGARLYANQIHGRSQDKVFEKAILYRDIVAVENWIDEVAKEYTE